MHSVSWPAVDVIVAVYNEASTIDGKLRELVAIDYPPGKLRFIVVDGGSDDGTLARVARQASQDTRITVLSTRLADKTAQLNHALEASRTAWVLVTDADARMPPDTLRRLVAAATTDARVGVVGTPVLPERSHPFERWHWQLSNRLRRLEQRLGTTGLVVAPCYLFRRSLLDRFPADTTADDAHLACRAAAAGARVLLVNADVRELRTAATGAAWFRHKLRRTLGYLREVLRYLPCAGRMTHPMREVFLWRAIALTLMPLVGAAFIAGAASAWGLPGLAAILSVALVPPFLRHEPSRVGRLDVLLLPALPLWLVAITTTALLFYPFTRQTSRFEKVALRAGDGGTC